MIHAENQENVTKKLLMASGGLAAVAGDSSTIRQAIEHAMHHVVDSAKSCHTSSHTVVRSDTRYNPHPVDTFSRPLAQSRIVRTFQRWRERLPSHAALDELPGLSVPASHVKTLAGPTAFRENLLTLIAGARRRILIAALYLQDEDAGREVLEALYAARAANPQLEIAVYVDWHRAQRGLIGKQKSAGNAALYKAMAEKLGPGVTVYGVPVQRREILGVFHLKGFVIDDAVLFSGASLNDVYLQRHGRYRLDRYHLIHHRKLADSFATLIAETLRDSSAVHPLDRADTPATATLRPEIAKLRKALAHARYRFTDTPRQAGEIAITPLIGLGARQNELNQALLQLVMQSRHELTLLTPYFNLPAPLHRALRRQIKAGCRVTIVLGDKTANDFYISPEEPFKTIGALPYLYESNLRRFCKTNQAFIDAGILDVRIWKDGNNTFHLKGLLADDDRALLTGHNFNPRAWRLDLENGLLIHDPEKLLADQNHAELQGILANTTRLTHYDEIEAMDAYPPPVQRLLKRLAHVKADRLINRIL